MARIIVTDGETRTALAATRSLGRAGYEVAVVGALPMTLAGRSRFVKRRAVLANSELDPDAFASGIGALSAEWHADLVLPVTDGAMTSLLRKPIATLGGARLIAPPRGAYEALSDKAELLVHARAVGIPVPRTIRVELPSDLDSVAREVSFPCVLKPHRSVVPVGGVLRHVYVGYSKDVASLKVLAARYPASAYPMLIQERIVGQGEGAFFLMDQGRAVTAFAHRRIREYPVSGGASTYRESIPVADDVRDCSERLLKSAGWHGAAMVEFKRSATTGIAYLMEVNGRLWGSLKLAIDSGIDFPVLLARIAMGQAVPDALSSYKTGLRVRWFWGDVNHLLDRLRHSNVDLDLSPEAPSRVRALLEFLKVHPIRDHAEVFAWDDPRPWLLESRTWLVEMSENALKKLRR